MNFLDSRRLLKEGQEAPDFTAKLTTGKTISLKEYRERKNVVLFFYPKDFTSGCTEQVCSFRDNYQDVLKYDAIMLGVSADGEESHQEFIRMHGLPFPLISDPDKSIVRAYGTSGRFMGMVPGAKRVTYVIDKQGTIRSVMHHELRVGLHLSGILEALKEIEGRELQGSKR